MDMMIPKVKEEMGKLDEDVMAYADDLACWSQNGENIIKVMTCFFREVGGGGFEDECG